MPHDIQGQNKASVEHISADLYDLINWILFTKIKFK